jgi:predicted DNA-binding WGR domain protein
MPKETPTPATAADLAAENATLKARIAQFEAAKKQADADEILIAEKMAKGLRREQAAAVLKRQREFDARKTQATSKK